MAVVPMSSSNRMAVVLRGIQSGQLRWGVLMMLFMVTVINYLDRQSLSVLAPVIISDLRLSAEQYSHVILAFMIGNAVIQLPFGPFLDRVGVRLGLGLSVMVWTLGAGLHALAASALSLACFRFILGLGEGGNWPASTKAVAEWFPSEERGFAMGFFNGGTAIGAIMAPPVVAFMATKLGWRYAFLLTPLISMLWLIIWFRTYHSPQDHPKLCSEERELLINTTVAGSAATHKKSKSALLTSTRFWGIFAARFITTPVWWFVAYWLPLYLKQQYGFTLVKIGAFAWIPFLAADIGNMVGGALSGRLIGKGQKPVKARLIVLGVSSVVMIASVPAVYARSAWLSIALISIVTFAYGSWAANILALAADQFEGHEVGTVVSWSGTGAVLGGAIFTFFVGKVADVAYLPVFVAAGVMPIVGFGLTALLNWKRSEVISAGIAG